MIHHIRRWRMLCLSPVEQRRCLREMQLYNHNKRVARANVPRNGLDYELMQKRLSTLSVSLIDGLTGAVANYAPGQGDEG